MAHWVTEALSPGALHQDWTDVMYINMYGCDKYFYYDAEWSRPLCTHPEANEGVTVVYVSELLIHVPQPGWNDRLQ